MQAVCDRIVVINKGRIAADDSAENLASNLSADHKLSVRIEGPVREVKKILEAIPDMKKVIVVKEMADNITEYSIESKENTDIRKEMFNRLASRKYPILLLKSAELTLEEIFIKLTNAEFYGEELKQ